MSELTDKITRLYEVTTKRKSLTKKMAPLEKEEKELKKWFAARSKGADKLIKAAGYIAKVLWKDRQAYEVEASTYAEVTVTKEPPKGAA